MSMKKVVFYVVTGETDKAKMALTVARRAAEFKRFEDVKVVLQGPSEKLIIDEDPAMKDNLDFLIKNKCIDSACKFIADKMQISDSIMKRGVELKPGGERLAALVNDDYLPLVF
jgi:hypothetical protein